ncbi:MAG: hypothetical protein KDC23_07150 [Actinobacteria bacterium]|nr:hypothetical protein [Actinomycetota bacterium]
MSYSTLSVGAALLLAGAASSAMLMSASASSEALPTVGSTAAECSIGDATISQWHTALAADSVVVHAATATGLTDCVGAQATLTLYGPAGKAMRAGTAVVDPAGDAVFSFAPVPSDDLGRTTLTIA